MHWRVESANLNTPQPAIEVRLNELAPLYAGITASTFGNLTGDALEIMVFRCLDDASNANPRYPYQGYFHLDKPKNEHGRFQKVQPPKTVSSRTTIKEADFLQFGYAKGALCIECKNYREWIYPEHEIIKELIIKATDLDLIPVLIARRLHYTTRTNFFEPAGIIAHESYFQYYPSDKAELAERVRHKRSLGFTDVLATEDPHPRTRKFLLETLPKIVPHMAKRWNTHKHDLLRYANGEIHLSQLYTEIGSPAGGKWQDWEAEPPENY